MTNGDGRDQSSTAADATGASPYLREGLERFYRSAAMEEICISKASLVLALIRCIRSNLQPRCSGSYSPAQQQERHPRKAQAAHGEQLFPTKCCYQHSRKIFPTSQDIKMHSNDIIFAATKPSHAAISLAEAKHVCLAQKRGFSQYHSFLSIARANV